MDQSGEHLHQRALSSAVFSDQAEDLSARDIQRDIIDRACLAVSLAECMCSDRIGLHMISPFAFTIGVEYSETAKKKERKCKDLTFLPDSAGIRSPRRSRSSLSCRIFRGYC